MPSVELIQKEARLLRNELGIWFLWKGWLPILKLIFSPLRCGGYGVASYRGRFRVGEYDKGQPTPSDETL